MDVPVSERGTYRFGPYRLDPTRRALTRDGARIALAARPFETLLYLVEHSTRLVTKDELLTAVWQGRVVEESNLAQVISTLRRSLQADDGEALIATVAGRGYRFAAAVRFEPEAMPVAPISFAVPPVAEAAAPGLVKRQWWWPAAAALAVVAAGVLVWRGRAVPPPGEAAFTPPPHSVAVLAFDNMSGDARDNDFADGMAEEVINALASVNALQVAARTSSFSFKGGHATVGEIARALNVGAVLEGSVRRGGGRIRITTELVNAATGFHIWSRSYDRDEGDMLRVQGDIAASVADALQVTLLGDGAAQLTLGGTASAKAFDAYLRGVKLMETGEADTYRQAVAAFDAALAIDPNYAMARAQRATALNQIGLIDGNPAYGGAEKVFPQALAEADRAVALAPALGLAHAARSRSLELGSQDFAGAEAEAARAVALSPGSSAVEMAYGRLEIELGRPGVGVAAIQRAAALDPLTANTYSRLAAGLYFAHQPPAALEALRHAASLDPHEPPRDVDLRAAIMLMLGDWQAVLTLCKGEADWSQSQALAIAYHGLGRQAEAERARLAMVKTLGGDDDGVPLAELYAQWGQRDLALKAFDVALHTPGGNTAVLLEDPMLDPIRDAQAYKDGVKQLGFPP